MFTVMQTVMTSGILPIVSENQLISNGNGQDTRAGTEWIPQCRSKLKERELMLIGKRQKKCLDVIALSVDQFTRQNTRYFIEIRGKTTIRVQRMDKTNREMVNHFLNPQTQKYTIASCSAALTEALAKWGGVRRSSKFTEDDNVPFKAYYRTAQNWFDQCKVPLLSKVYWIPIFAVIQQVCT